MIKKDIENYLDHQIRSINELKKETITIEEIYNVLKKARNNKNKIYIMGNGGSSSTASHFTSDLLKTSLMKDKNRFKAASLSDNIPVLLAWANDTSYDNIFSGQLENFLEKDDIVIGISGSGNSKNVLKAIEFANKNGAITISLTGKGGGKLAEITKINLTIPSDDMLTIETIHLLICHLLTTLIRNDGDPIFSY